MCIKSSYRVSCTQCGAECSEEGETKREALQLAKEEGFTRRLVENGTMWDFCPKHPYTKGS